MRAVRPAMLASTSSSSTAPCRISRPIDAGNWAPSVGARPCHTRGMPVSMPAARLRVAFDLFDLGGDQMMRARLRREHVEWTEAQVQAAIEQ